MFYKVFSAALFCSFFSNTYAFQFPLEIIDYMDDATIIVYAKKDDINSTSSWLPGEGNIPLGINDLVSTVNNWLKTQSKMAGLKINEIELKKVKKHEKDNYWYYLVQLKNNNDTQYLAVLMNGQILPAIKEPKSYK